MVRRQSHKPNQHRTVRLVIKGGGSVAAERRCSLAFVEEGAQTREMVGPAPEFSKSLTDEQMLHFLRSNSRN